LVDADADEHHIKDGGKETLLKRMRFFELETRNGLPRRRGYFIGYRCVFAVVVPELLLRDTRFPCLSLLFPVFVIGAVKGREKVKPLWKPWKDTMVRKHGILPVPRDKPKVTGKVLSVVETVLPQDATVWMAKKVTKRGDDFEFFFEVPIPFW
jgi:hypothetical protein